MTSTTAFAIALLIATVWIVRMLRPRRVRARAASPLVLLLAVLGCVALAAAMCAVPAWTSRAIIAAVAAVGIVAVGAFAGLLRGRTVRLWRDETGTAWRRGGALTVATWLLWVVVHIVLDRGVDALDPGAMLGMATLWAGLAASLAAQGYVVRRRTEALTELGAGTAPVRA